MLSQRTDRSAAPRREAGSSDVGDRLLARARSAWCVRASGSAHDSGPPYRALARALTVILSPLLDLHSHPRSLVQITVQTTSLPSTRFAKPFRAFEATVDTTPEEPLKRASELACALNAATCALIDLGGSVGLKGTAYAVGVAITNEDEILLDPTAEQERDAAMTLVIGFSFGHGEGAGGDEGVLVWCETASTGTKGRGVTRETLDASIELARQACQATRAFVRRAVEAKLLKGETTMSSSTASAMEE